MINPPKLLLLVLLLLTTHNVFPQILFVLINFATLFDFLYIETVLLLLKSLEC